MEPVTPRSHSQEQTRKGLERLRSLEMSATYVRYVVRIMTPGSGSETPRTTTEKMLLGKEVAAMRLSRIVLITAAVAVAALFGPASAGAVPPVREPLVFPEELPLPAGVFCPWEGLVTFPVTREYATTFYDSEGNITRVLITGSLVITVTNVENGESVTLNIPGSTVAVDDLVTYRGRNVIFPVSGELKLVSGLVVVTVDSAGFQHPVTIHGSTVDICALLA